MSYGDSDLCVAPQCDKLQLSVNQIATFLETFTNQTNSQLQHLTIDIDRINQSFENLCVTCECGRKISVVNGKVSIASCSKESESGDDKTKETKKKSIFTYSEDLKNIIANPITSALLEGPVMHLDENGECRFVPAIDDVNQVNQAWQSLVTGMNCPIKSRLILLPSHWDGLIVEFTLNFSTTHRIFLLEMKLPDIPQNKTVKFPQLINVQLQIRLLNKQMFIPQIYQFYIKNNNPKVLYAPSYRYNNPPIQKRNQYGQQQQIIQCNLEPTNQLKPSSFFKVPKPINVLQQRNQLGPDVDSYSPYYPLVNLDQIRFPKICLKFLK